MTRLEPLLDWYQKLTPQTLEQIGAFYRPDAHFKDPFNDVLGVAAIRRVFVHMFESTQAPRFSIRETITGPDRVFLSWDFDFGLRGRHYHLHGATRLLFDEAGKIVDHRDYWDPAEELWQKLPVVGGAVAWVRGRFRVPQP